MNKSCALLVGLGISPLAAGTVAARAADAPASAPAATIITTADTTSEAHAIAVVEPTGEGGRPTAADTDTRDSTAPEKGDSGSIGDLSLEQLMNVKVTTVSREDSTVGESAAAVFVITREMIRRSGANEIPELLRMVPGLDVAKINANQWAVSARGFNGGLSNKLLVQIDGRTLYNPIYSYVNWETVDYPLEDIERIEVVRGPGGSVWGANAVDGVINIITRKAADTQGWLLSGGGGSAEKAFGTIRYGGSGEKGDFRVYAKEASRDSSFNPTGIEPDAWHSGSAGFRWDKPFENGSFTLQGDAFSTVAGQDGVNVDLRNPPTFISTDTADQDATGANILARWTHKQDENTSSTLQAYYDLTKRNFLNQFAHWSIGTADIDYQRQSTRGERQNYVYGLGARVQSIDFNGSAAIDSGLTTSGQSFAISPTHLTETRKVFSAFVQDEIKLREKLKLTLGSKIEHNDYTSFEFEPTARLLWTPDKRHSVWASVSRAVRTPSLIENNIDLAFPMIGHIGLVPVFVVIAPNQGLQSETVVAQELGYRTQATDKLSFDAAAFFNKYHGLTYNPLIVSNIGAGPFPGSLTWSIPFENGPEADTHGFELSTNYDVSKRWKLYGAYTYTCMSLHAPDDVNVEGQTPRNQIYVRSSFDLPHNCELDLIGRYVSKLDGFTPTIPAYTAMDVRLAWRQSEKVEYSVVGQNLFANHHAEFVDSTHPIMYVQAGVYGKVTYQW